MTFTILGSGFILGRHVDAIHSLGGRIRQIINTTHGDNHWREALKTDISDAIVILTPNFLHYPMAKAAAEMGKIVLCEKPLCLTIQEAKDLAQYPSIFTSMQLRYHPLIQQCMRANEVHSTVTIDISVYRDPSYFESWKGRAQESGGILFNLGVHYFDIFRLLFGKAISCTTSFINNGEGEGAIVTESAECTWRISIRNNRNDQKRKFTINGNEINFSSKDNLSLENLHLEVYKDLLKGKGVRPADVLPTIELIEMITRQHIPLETYASVT